LRSQLMIDLAHELEWLGCELEFIGKKHALEGFPGAGRTWDSFLEKQRGVMLTADKIERELKDSIRFNPSRLVGTTFAIDQALDAITQLLSEVETIKHAAVFAVHEMPGRVRGFSRAIEDALIDSVPMQR
jgi:hypothetical protein